MKHTPGPWKSRGEAGYTGHGVNDTTGRSVCSIPSNGNRAFAERNANAVLLASAPDLLAALEAIVTLLVEQPESYIHVIEGEARQAIAKALGEKQ